MADSAAVAGGRRAGITFGVELVIPLDAPEAVIDLNLDGLMDLDIVPDVIGLTGRRPDAAVCRILQGCAECACSGSGLSRSGAELSCCDHR